MAEKLAIILAAGASTRMKTALPKALHEVCGRPMLDYVVDACRTAGVGRIIVVVGYGKERIIEQYQGQDDISFVEQVEQKGTGHAVLCCKEQLKDFDGVTMVVCGDGPLIKGETLKTLVDKHLNEKSSMTLGTAIMDDPFGYGRIARDQYGNIQGIVEHNDCDNDQLRIHEINPSLYCFDNKVMLDALGRITPNNVKNEYYITDALGIVITDGHKVIAVTAVSPEEVIGVNSRKQLSECGKIMQKRVQDWFMDNGVTIVDPPNTWIDARVEIGQDSVIEPFTCIYGKVKIGSNCRIGPFVCLNDGAVIEDGETTGVFKDISKYP